MRIMGIHTAMSCGGHLRRVTGGPYIMFTSPTAKKYADRCRQIGDSRDISYKASIKSNKRELTWAAKIYSLLERFYANRAVTFSQRLALRTAGLSASRLDCQGAEMAHIVNIQTRKWILTNNQAEMRGFTEFLKTDFLKQYKKGLHCCSLERQWRCPIGGREG